MFHKNIYHPVVLIFLFCSVNYCLGIDDNESNQKDEEVEGKPRDFVQCALKPGETDFYAGPDLPVFSLEITNDSEFPINDIEINLEVTDVITNRILLAKKNKLDILNSREKESFEFPMDTKYGQFIRIKWETSDADGIITQASGQSENTRLFRNLSLFLSKPAERKYLTNWSAPGGVLWSLPYKRAGEVGAAWMRIVYPHWGSNEISPGVYDFESVLDLLKSNEPYSLDPIYASMIHNRPEFYNEHDYSFAPAYGAFNRALAITVGDRINHYEMGNEANGPIKYIYTEIARHGAVALRSINPDAVIGNAGTAGIDIGFLRMQAERGLFEYLDEIVTHPYTFGASPEESKIYERYMEVNTLVDDMGGMKFHSTTEWGWPHSKAVPESGWYVDQDMRACYIVRQFAIGAAGGIIKDGLFAWDNHFGIYDNGRPYPAAASVNAYCALTRGHEYAGWLQRTDDVWALVFERAGIPLIMAWSPSGKGTISFESAMPSVIVRDMYGNQVDVPKSDGNLELSFDGHPVYVEGLPSSVLLSAWHNTMIEANKRFRKVLSESKFKGILTLEEIAEKDIPDYETIKEALMSWQPTSSNIEYKEQAVIAQAIRLAILAARISAVKSNEEKHTSINQDAVDKWRIILEKNNNEDIDIPSLRWIFSVWDKTSDEAKMHVEDGKEKYATYLEDTGNILDKFCGVMVEKGHKVFYPVWPYLYASKGSNDEFVEHLTFVPGQKTDTQIRLYSYGHQPYKAKVHLDLPQDWICEPNYWEGIINPDQQIGTVFHVYAGLEKTKIIYVILSVDGKPDVKIPYDNFEIQMPISIEFAVLDSLLPDGPLVLNVVNRGQKPVSGKLRILPAVDLPPFAYEDIKNIQAGESRQVELKLKEDLLVPPYNEWNLVAYFKANNQEILSEISPDFSCATKAINKPVIDAYLEEWITAPVIHMDKESYTDGSFGNDWSKEDLSAKVYSMWDDNKFYYAAKVEDQWFQQGVVGAGVFAQDSIQIAFSSDDKTIQEFSLALTPEGPQVWGYNKEGGKNIDKAELAVRVISGTGNAVYECSIPWFEILPQSPSDDQIIRYDILLNDDDIVYPRRYMFRYGHGIVHTKNLQEFGYLHLCGNQQGATIENDEKNNVIVFKEDFEEYENGVMPDGWLSITHLPPAPESVVRPNVGRNNSKALVLNNKVGPKPAVYRNLVRQPRNWHGGQKYELSAWVKGDGVTGIGIASDLAGVQGFQYIPNWESSNEWQQIKLEITPTEGLYLIIRNETKMNDLIIDDIEIIQK